MYQASPELSKEIRKLQKFVDDGGTIHAAQLKELATIANIVPEAATDEQKAATAARLKADDAQATADAAKRADRPGLWTPSDKPGLQATADRAQHDADV